MILQIRVSFEDVFPAEEPQDLQYYLQGLEEDLLKRIVIRLVRASKQDSAWRDWKVFIFEKWFSTGNVEIANYVYKKILNLEKQYPSERRQVFSIVNPDCSLVLLENILSIRSKENDIDLLQAEINIFKAILITNSRLNEYDDRLKGIELEENNIPVDMSIAIAFGLAQHELINKNILDLLYLLNTQFVKAVYLSDFLQEKKPDLLRSFLLKYNCSDFQQYLNMFFNVLIIHVFRSAIDESNNAPSLTVISIEPGNTKSLNFISSFLSKSNYENEDVDFINLRSFPMIEVRKNEYAIVNEIFTIQKIYNGLYFELRDLSKNINDKDFKNFRKYFTDEFTEKTLLYRIMNAIYGGRSYVRHSGADIESKFLFKGGPDYYIRNGNKIILIENKDNLLKAEVKTSHNIFTIIEEIDRLFVNEKKGLPQIIKNIEFALSKSFPFDKKYSTNSCKIYPILIINRPEFDTPGLNRYLNSRFNTMLIDLEQKGYNISNVRGVTIMNIDTLVLFQNQIKDKKIKIEEAIDAYQSMVYEKIVAKNREDYDTKYSKSLNSFYDYVCSDYAKKMGIGRKEPTDFWLGKYFKD